MLKIGCLYKLKWNLYVWDQSILKYEDLVLLLEFMKNDDEIKVLARTGERIIHKRNIESISK